MRKVPIWFDHDISIAEIKQALAAQGFELRGGRFDVVVVRKDTPASRHDADAVARRPSALEVLPCAR